MTSEGTLFFFEIPYVYSAQLMLFKLYYIKCRYCYFLKMPQREVTPREETRLTLTFIGRGEKQDREGDRNQPLGTWVLWERDGEREGEREREMGGGKGPYFIKGNVANMPKKRSYWLQLRTYLVRTLRAGLYRCLNTNRCHIPLFFSWLSSCIILRFFNHLGAISVSWQSV